MAFSYGHTPVIALLLAAHKVRGTQSRLSLHPPPTRTHTHPNTLAHPHPPKHAAGGHCCAGLSAGAARCHRCRAGAASPARRSSTRRKTHRGVSWGRSYLDRGYRGAPQERPQHRRMWVLPQRERMSCPGMRRIRLLGRAFDLPGISTCDSSILPSNSRSRWSLIGSGLSRAWRDAHRQTPLSGCRCLTWPCSDLRTVAA